MAPKTLRVLPASSVFGEDWALVPAMCTVLLGRGGELNPLFFHVLLFYALFP
jgi:hypothetical protein